MAAYDEFGMLHENAAEYDLPFDEPPAVRRETVALPSGLSVSALVWGTDEPELVLVHGGAQNAHTWDTVALRLGRPLVAVDLPGHGHSDHRPEHDYTPTSMAADLAVALRQLAPRAEAVVGMSLGGMTSICLAADHPDLVRRLGVVDVTPGTDHEKAEPIIASSTVPSSSPISTRSSPAPSSSTRAGARRRCAEGCSTTPTRPTTAAGPGATTACATGR